MSKFCRAKREAENLSQPGVFSFPASCFAARAGDYSVDEMVHGNSDLYAELLP